MIQLKRILYIFAAVLVISISEFPQSETNRLSKSSVPKYFLIQNYLERGLDRSDPDRRFLIIWLARKSFGSQKLLALSKRLSRKFPNPALLEVLVYSRRRDAEASRIGPGRISEGGSESGTNLAPHAVFVRRVDRTILVRIIYGGNNSETIFP